MLALKTAPKRTSTVGSNVIIDCNIDNIRYGNFLAVRDTRLPILRKSITAIIGPSGCGKSTVLRCINRINDLTPGFRFEGSILFHGRNLYGAEIDPIAVRQHIGMVFQEPNPFAMSIFDNVAFGLRINACRDSTEERVEHALREAALWDEVKDKLDTSGLRLSGGQQQRLCIARAIAPRPEVLLMDEPCSALDPTATRRIEELIKQLKEKFTIVIITHKLEQAKRLADATAFMYVDAARGDRTGYLVEYGDTEELFHDPREKHTRDFLQGVFG